MDTPSPCCSASRGVVSDSWSRCSIPLQGLLNATQVVRKLCNCKTHVNISETMQNSDRITTDRWYEVTYILQPVEQRHFQWPSRALHTERCGHASVWSLPLSQIFSTIDSLPAPRLTPRTSWLYRFFSAFREFFMAALRSRCGHYIFAVVSFFFFSSPNLSRRRLDVYHTSTHGVYGPSANLECRSEMCCTRLAENAGPKNRQKFAIWAPSHKFVGLYLRN